MEIRNILNGFNYTKYEWSKFKNYYDEFIDIFYRIKNGKKIKKRRLLFKEWLDYKEIQNVIKRWEGEPIDVIYYINRIGLIEKALNWEIKMYLRK